MFMWELKQKGMDVKHNTTAPRPGEKEPFWEEELSETSLKFIIVCCINIQ